MVIEKELFFRSAIRNQLNGALFYMQVNQQSEMTKALNTGAFAKITPSTGASEPKKHKTNGFAEPIATAMYIESNGHFPSAVATDEHGNRKESVNARIAA